MYQTKREIDTIIVHCAATKPSMDVSVNDIRLWHTEPKPKGRGWSDIGYHYYIKFDGTLYEGRPIEKAGAHAKGYNQKSIGVCLEGGINEKGEPEKNFTENQMKTLRLLCDLLVEQYGADVRGHRDFNPDKECPCFDVFPWLAGYAD